MEQWRREQKEESYNYWKRAMNNFAVEIDNHYHKFTVEECSLMAQVLDIVDNQTKQMEKELSRENIVKVDIMTNRKQWECDECDCLEVCEFGDAYCTVDGGLVEELIVCPEECCEECDYPILDCICEWCDDCGGEVHSCHCEYCNNCNELDAECICEWCDDCGEELHSCFCEYCNDCNELETYCICEIEEE